MSTPVYCKPEPMDLSNAEDEGEAELQVAEQQHEVIRCHMCGSAKHLRPTFPLHKQLQTPISRNPDPTRNLVWHGESSTNGERGVPYWGRTELCNFSTRYSETGLSPTELCASQHRAWIQA